jgi:signal transduction histidine kinase
VRTRLTMLYSVVFLLCGAALLAITYQLVEHSTDDAFYTNAGTDTPSKGGVLHQNFTGVPNLHPLGQAKALIAQTQAGDLHQLLVKSGIALAIMAVVAVAAGYLLAGRILRPLHHITVTAQGISAGNLHERLAMVGPRDEMKNLGDTFDELLARLEASFESQRHFVANASHELRSPLTRLRLVAEVAATDSQATVESLRHATERVIVAAERQEQLLDALLVLAQSQSGLNHGERLDLSEICNDVLLRPDLDIDTLALHVKTAIRTAPLEGDPSLIERLVTNLIENAIGHNMPAGLVDIATDMIEGKAVLTVTNTGPVIPQDEFDRLFRPFQRLDPNRIHHKGGHGLGLSIVQAIATAHSATITTQPQPEGGLSVRVIFPPPTRHAPGGESCAPMPGPGALPSGTCGPKKRTYPVRREPRRDLRCDRTEADRQASS